MMHDALKEKAPALYRQLEVSGKLKTYVETQAEEMDQAIMDEVSRRMVKKEVQELPYMEKVQRLNQIKREAQEQGFATYLNEFPGQSDQ